MPKKRFILYEKRYIFEKLIRKKWNQMKHSNRTNPIPFAFIGEKNWIHINKFHMFIKFNFNI